MKELVGILIQSDGGCRPTNPGNMYGSYLIEKDDGTEILRMSRLELGSGTNNEAEFIILETALDKLNEELLNSGFEPKRFFVCMETDSTIVRNRIAMVGRNKVLDLNLVQRQNVHERSRANRMSELAMRCHTQLAKFGGYSIKWQSRRRNVEAFGH